MALLEAARPRSRGRRNLNNSRKVVVPSHAFCSLAGAAPEGWPPSLRSFVAGAYAHRLLQQPAAAECGGPGSGSSGLPRKRGVNVKKLIEVEVAARLIVDLAGCLGWLANAVGVGVG